MEPLPPVRTAARGQHKVLLGKSEFEVRLRTSAREGTEDASLRDDLTVVALPRSWRQIDARYVNLKPIGRGAYGLVAAADDLLTGRKVRERRGGQAPLARVRVWLLAVVMHPVP